MNEMKKIKRNHYRDIKVNDDLGNEGELSSLQVLLMEINFALIF